MTLFAAMLYAEFRFTWFHAAVIVQKVPVLEISVDLIDQWISVTKSWWKRVFCRIVLYRTAIDSFNKSKNRERKS